MSGTDSAATKEEDAEFDSTFRHTVKEYAETKDRLEYLQNQLEKMLDMKDARMKADLEKAKARMALSSQEDEVVRKMFSLDLTALDQRIKNQEERKSVVVEPKSDPVEERAVTPSMLSTCCDRVALTNSTLITFI